MSIPSITDLVRDFVPSFPTAGPTAGIGGSPVPVDSYTPEPTPGDDLGGVTGGGSAFRYPVTTLAHPINPALLTDDGWTSTGTSSGVRIEKKTVDGMTAYRATRGGLTIPPEKIARAIMQVDRYKDRGIKYVDSVQVLSRANGRIVYGQHLNFGAIADRLSVLEIGVTKWTGAELEIPWSQFCDEAACYPDWVAQEKERGHGLFKPVYTPINQGMWRYSNGELSQIFYVDAGGSVPVNTTPGAMAGNVNGMVTVASKL